MKPFAYLFVLTVLTAFTGCASDQPTASTTTTTEETTSVSQPQPIGTTTTETVQH